MRALLHLTKNKHQPSIWTLRKRAVYRQQGFIGGNPNLQLAFALAAVIIFYSWWVNHCINQNAKKHYTYYRIY